MQVKKEFLVQELGPDCRVTLCSIGGRIFEVTLWHDLDDPWYGDTPHTVGYYTSKKEAEERYASHASYVRERAAALSL